MSAARRVRAGPTPIIMVPPRRDGIRDLNCRRWSLPVPRPVRRPAAGPPARAGPKCRTRDPAGHPHGPSACGYHQVVAATASTQARRGVRAGTTPRLRLRIGSTCAACGPPAGRRVSSLQPEAAVLVRARGAWDAGAGRRLEPGVGPGPSAGQRPSLLRPGSVWMSRGSASRQRVAPEA